MKKRVNYNYLMILLLSFITGNFLWADLPYIPLEFKLSTVSDHYFEGDRIDFVLTIKNTDKKNTYPILTPGGMNSGNKIIYLRVFDPDERMFILRASETRAINMNIKNLGNYGVIYLQPEKKMTISFSWNDSIHFSDQVESHHSFDKPVFAGVYMFQAFYNPFGTGVGDTLYHLMNSTEDEQVNNKLNFLGPALSFPCKVVIKKRSGEFRIDGTKYRSSSIGEGDRGSLYYLKEDWDKYGNTANCIKETAWGETGYLYAEVTHTYYGVGAYIGMLSRKNELIFRDINGTILNYTLSDEGICPNDYFSRVYHPVENKIVLQQQVDTLLDGSVKSIFYNDDNTINTETIWSMNTYQVTTIRYYYKTGKLIRKTKVVKGSKTKKRKRGPCIMELL